MKNYFAENTKQLHEHEERVKAANEKKKNPQPGSVLLFGATNPASLTEILASFPSRYTADILVKRYFAFNDPSARK